MSKWTEFLAQIATADEITLVGPLYQSLHQPTSATIYVDGGSQFRMDGGRKPHPAHPGFFPTVSVGDGDSAPKALDELLPAEKDYSDLVFVLRNLPETVSLVRLFGFLGGRRDHELANFGAVHEYLTTRSKFTRVDFHGQDGSSVIGFTAGTLAVNVEGIFSVFVLESAPITIKGACRYPLENSTALKVLGSHGLSNEGFGRVEISSSRPCFLIK